jgi:hypothetical protein
MEIEHGGGIVFESVNEPDTLAAAETLIGETGYHGQISLDFRRGNDGRLWLIECNPRPSAGVHMMSGDLYVDALLEPPDGPARVVPPGVRRKYASAVLRELLLHPDHPARQLRFLFDERTHDVYDEPDDHLPSLYQAITYAYALVFRAQHLHSTRHGTGILAAVFDGIEWNGDPIP